MPGALAHVLDPQEVYGSDFPWGGETFRVLTKSPSFWGMEKEWKALTTGTLRSRTRRFVLEKRDGMSSTDAARNG